MKTFSTFLAIILLFGSTWAQTNEFLTKKEFQNEKKKTSDALNILKRSDSDVKRIISAQGQTVDSLKNIVLANKELTLKNNDSISGFSLKVLALQEQVNHQKLIRRPFLILFLAIFCILLISLFILLFRYKKNTELTINSMRDNNKKMFENIELEFKSVKESINQCQKEIQSLSVEMKQQILRLTENVNVKIDENHEKFLQTARKQDDTISNLNIMIAKSGSEMTKLIESSTNKSNDSLQNIVADINKLKLQVEKHLASH